MSQKRQYTKVLLVVAGAVVGLLLGQLTSSQARLAVAAPDGIPDEGLLVIQTNQKLDEVNGKLADVSTKLGAILELLKSGKIEVVAREQAARTAPAAAPDNAPAATFRRVD